MDDRDLLWEEVSTERLIQDEWIDFRKTAYRMPDGRIFQPYYTYSRRDFAVIVASDESGNYLCVRQFRQGIRRITTEFPAGAIETKDGEDPEHAAETALRAAQRELREETGYVSDDWRHLLTIPSSPTISDNEAWLFEARNCRLEKEQDLDEMEFIQVRKHSAQELQEMIADGRFPQAIHALAWLLSQKS